MRIVTTTTNDRKTLYQMTKGANINRIQDNEGKTITVADYVVYEDTKASGDTMVILSIRDESGEIFATNSPTFKEAFYDISVICGEPSDMVGEKVKIESGTSKAGRKFFTCSWT